MANGSQGELVSLDQLGIASINLDAAQEQVDQNGNTILADSSFTWKNGQTGDIAGVDLAYNSNATQSLSTPVPAQNTPNVPSSSEDIGVDRSLGLLTQALAGFSYGEGSVDHKALDSAGNDNVWLAGSHGAGHR